MGFGQLSTRESIPSVIHMGTRPEAGNFGIFIGPSISEIKDMVDKGIRWKGLPLVNFKYYIKDRLEVRLGLQFSKTREKSDGDLLNISNDYFEEEEGEMPDEEVGNTSVKVIDMNSYNRLTPGIAYHFSPQNIVDVYVGANVPLGWDRYKSVHNEGDIKNEVSQNVFVVGVGGFIGLQWFVADLPVALGFEYGFYGLSQSGMKYKHVVSDGETSQTYYTKDENDGVLYDNLKHSKFDFGTDLRITLSYYFKR